MAHDPSNYDDDRELCEYIWHNYRHLLTTRETLADRAFLLAEKNQYAQVRQQAANFLSRAKRNGPADLQAAIAEGRDALRAYVVNRILVEVAEEVSINRCPSCGRIVATPKAQQCLWCKHDWHFASV